jgi:hypothetical protein
MSDLDQHGWLGRYRGRPGVDSHLNRYDEAKVSPSSRTSTSAGLRALKAAILPLPIVAGDWLKAIPIQDGDSRIAISRCRPFPVGAPLHLQMLAEA